MVERPYIYYKINRNGFFPPSGEVLKEMWDTVYVRIRVGQVERTVGVPALFLHGFKKEAVVGFIVLFKSIASVLTFSP